MNPQEAAAAALDEGAEATGEAAGHMAAEGAEPSGAAMPGERAPSLVDGLLETQPSNSVEQFPSMPTWAAHCMIGTLKFVNGIASSQELGSGKPAIVNFAEAGISFYTGGSTSSDGSDESNAVGQV